MEEKFIKPALYLIPVGLSDASPESVVPRETIAILRSIKHLVVENLRTARRWIKRCDRDIDIDSISFSELNEHSDLSRIGHLLEPLRNGEPMGIMSEAGCPGVADPGAALVELAHKENLPVVPLVGPSSILLSLMASGFNGQNFAFHGYLPISDAEKARSVRAFEKDSQKSGTTHIFIETPYRNNKLVRFLAETLSHDTKICVAANLTDPVAETVMVKSASDWRKADYDFSKQPAIFLLSAFDLFSNSIHTKKR